MSKVDDLIQAETDGSCAYCGIRDQRVLTVHHINQRKPKDESYGNKILLCHNCHQLYHQKKGPSLNDLRAIKRRLIGKTLTKQGVNALKEAYRSGIVSASPYIVNHLVEMQLLKQVRPHFVHEVDEKKTVGTAIYELTPGGKAFTEKWRLK